MQSSAATKNRPYFYISHDGLRNYIIQRLQSKYLSLKKCCRDQVNRHIVRITSLSIALRETREVIRDFESFLH